MNDSHGTFLMFASFPVSVSHGELIVICEQRRHHWIRWSRYASTINLHCCFAAILQNEFCYVMYRRELKLWSKRECHARLIRFRAPFSEDRLNGKRVFTEREKDKIGLVSLNFLLVLFLVFLRTFPFYVKASMISDFSVGTFLDYVSFVCRL